MKKNEVESRKQKFILGLNINEKIAKLTMEGENAQKVFLETITLAKICYLD